ncbi:hypothetical protein D9619_012444 [Psilocybe cf. subviscida]|uniref:Uncharacterized protein n=1 Tax=Psilocybe cf. subviscida TaxID=2480587 RepID=A0A8H5AR67_9AGAR|nr:hypothetical protein D9619_012444 [Psilocybe cf. subviscida]
MMRWREYRKDVHFPGFSIQQSLGYGSDPRSDYVVQNIDIVDSYTRNTPSTPPSTRDTDVDDILPSPPIVPAQSLDANPDSDFHYLTRRGSPPLVLSPRTRQGLVHVKQNPLHPGPRVLVALHAAPRAERHSHGTLSHSLVMQSRDALHIETSP